jgi:hypothetical protein
MPAELPAVIDVAMSWRHRLGGRFGGGHPPCGLESRDLGRWERERLGVRRIGALEIECQVVRERDLQECLPGAHAVPSRLHERERAAVEADRLVLRINGPSRVPRFEEVFHRSLWILRLAEVAR